MNGEEPTKHDSPPTPSEVLKAFIEWLRGFHLDRERSKAADWAMVGLTALGLIAAGISVVFVYLQLRDAQDNFRVDERAWIELEPIKPPTKVVDKKGIPVFSYELFFKNVGKTVATETRLHAAFVTLSLPTEREITTRQEALAKEDYTGAEYSQHVEEDLEGKPHESSPVKPFTWFQTVIAPGTTTPVPYRLTTTARDCFNEAQCPITGIM